MEILDLEEVLRGAGHVAISGHVKPDGDCVGSCLGLYHYLKGNLGLNVDLYLEEIPTEFLFLNGADEIRHEASKQDYDVYFALDCGDRSRLGFAAEMFDRANRKVCIDHHCSNNGFAQYNYVIADASSTSELVYDLIDHDKLTPEIAECLYLGIVHDTGIFQYSCTSPKTMRVAAKLMETGISFSEIVDETYNEKSFTQNLLLGEALCRAKLDAGGKIISSVITQETMRRHGAIPMDMEGIVSQLRITKGVEVAVLLYENLDGSYKLSLRSKRYADVAKIAVQFGGGGHVRAAGATLVGDPEALLDMVVGEIEKVL